MSLGSGASVKIFVGKITQRVPALIGDTTRITVDPVGANWPVAGNTAPTGGSQVAITIDAIGDNYLPGRTGSSADQAVVITTEGDGTKAVDKTNWRDITFTITGPAGRNLTITGPYGNPLRATGPTT